MHTVEQRHAARLCKPRHGLVRREHEVLDHQLSLAPRSFGDLHRFARIIQDEFRLVRVKVDRALRLPPLADAPRQLAHGQQRLLEPGHPLPLRRVAVKEPVHVVIHQPRVGARDRAQQARVHHAARIIHIHQRAHGELVLVRTQRAHAVGELLRQHRQHAPREVHARAAQIGLAVERRALRHIVSHVRDVHAQAPEAVLQAFQAHRVVKVLRVAAVDGEGQQAAQVGSLRIVCQVGRLAGVRLAQRILAKRRAQVLADDQRIERGPRLAEAAQNAVNAHQQAAFVLPAHHLRVHNVAIMRLLPARAHRDALRQPALQREDIAHALLFMQHADDLLVRALKHPAHAHALTADPLSLHNVAPQCAVGVLPGAGICGAVLGLHLHCAVEKAAHGQAQRLALLLAFRLVLPGRRSKAADRDAADKSCLSRISFFHGLHSRILRFLFVQS